MNQNGWASGGLEKKRDKQAAEVEITWIFFELWTMLLRTEESEPPENLDPGPNDETQMYTNVICSAVRD